MARDVHRVIDLLERKAADRAVSEAERDALLAKASQLRSGAPPRPPAAPPRAPSGADEPPRRQTVWVTTSSGMSTSTNFAGGSFTVSFTIG